MINLFGKFKKFKISIPEQDYIHIVNLDFNSDYVSSWKEWIKSNILNYMKSNKNDKDLTILVNEIFNNIYYVGYYCK